MNQILTEIKLGAEALEYIRQSLNDGKQLSRATLTALDIGAGKVSTYLPPGTTALQANKFLTGGKLEIASSESPAKAHPIPNTDDILAATLRGHLKSSDSALCIFENALAQAGDPWLRQAQVHSFVCGTDVYHFLTAKDVESDLIESTINTARSIRPPLIGVLTRSERAGSTDSAQGTIKLVELQNLASRAEKLVVGAYDGESFLLWSR